MQKNTRWCLVELFKNFETCLCLQRLQSHESRAVQMKNTAMKYIFQKLTSPRILVISKAIKVSM